QCSGGVGEMGLAVYAIAVNLGAKNGFDLRCSPAEVELGVAARRPYDLQAAGTQPSADFVQIGIRHAKSLSVLFRSQPLTEIGGSRVLLLPGQLIKTVLLLVCKAKYKRHAIEGHVRADPAAIKFRVWQSANGAGKRDQLRLIDGAVIQPAWAITPC